MRHPGTDSRKQAVRARDLDRIDVRHRRFKYPAPKSGDKAIAVYFYICRPGRDPEWQRRTAVPPIETHRKSRRSVLRIERQRHRRVSDIGRGGRECLGISIQTTRRLGAPNGPLVGRSGAAALVRPAERLPHCLNIHERTIGKAPQFIQQRLCSVELSRALQHRSPIGRKDGWPEVPSQIAAGRRMSAYRSCPSSAESSNGVNTPSGDGSSSPAPSMSRSSSARLPSGVPCVNDATSRFSSSFCRAPTTCDSRSMAMVYPRPRARMQGRRALSGGEFVSGAWVGLPVEQRCPARIWSSIQTIAATLVGRARPGVIRQALKAFVAIAPQTTALTRFQRLNCARRIARLGLVAICQAGTERECPTDTCQAQLVSAARAGSTGLAGHHVPAGAAPSAMVRALRQRVRHGRVEQHVLPAPARHDGGSLGVASSRAICVHAQARKVRIASHEAPRRTVVAAKPCRSCHTLGKSLGPTLVQLPPRWRRNVERLDEFLSVAPRSMRWAVEVRDESWIHDDTFEVLRQHDAALCIHDLLPKHPWLLTASWSYVRFHGPHAMEQKYVGRYGGRRLWRAHTSPRRVARAGHDVYAYFNNDFPGDAVIDASWLDRRLHRRINQSLDELTGRCATRTSRFARYNRSQTRPPTSHSRAHAHLRSAGPNSLPRLSLLLEFVAEFLGCLVEFVTSLGSMSVSSSSTCASTRSQSWRMCS